MDGTYDVICRKNRSRSGLRRAGAMLNLLSAVAVLSVLAFVAWRYWFTSSNKPEDLPDLATVVNAPFEHTVIEQGEVESSSNVEVRCEVKSRGGGGITIINVVPESTLVQAGDLLVKLDSTALEQELIQQQIVCNTAEANVIQAKAVFESAEIAKTEYLEGTFRQEEQLILGEIFVAEQNLRTAQLAMGSAERLSARGIVTSLQLEGDQFAVEKSRNELSAARTKLDVLRKYTRNKMLTKLESDIAAARAKWEAEKSTLELELTKRRDIGDQVAKCQVRAPHPGQVVYANKINTSSRGGATAEFIVEPGAIVREQQPLVRLPDPTNMQVRTLINESRVTLVRPGMPALIKLQALQDATLTGEVVKVNQYAEPGGWSSGSVKKYVSLVKINNPPPEMKVGMNAEVRIYVERRPDAVQIPIQAVAPHKQKFFCLVESNGKLETREIDRGPSNERFLVITKGLQPGEKVVLNPRSRAELQLPDLPELDPIASVIKPPSDAGITKKSTGGTGKGPGGKSGPRGEVTVASLLKRALDEFDSNKDGSLQRDELAAMPAERGANLQKADANNDGVLDGPELTVAMGNVAKMIRERTRDVSASGAGL